MPTPCAQRIPAFVTLAFAAASLLSLARPLAAQNEPIVTITPESGAYVLPTAAVEASVALPTQAEVNASTRTLFLNGVNVTGQFTQSAVAQTGMMGTWKVTYWGTLTLQSGSNTFVVQVVQPIPNSSAKDTARYTATYTYTPGSPAVRVSPDGGSATGATSGSQHTFRVANPGTGQGTYALRAECRDAWTGAALSGCTASSSTVTVNAGDSATVTVTAPAGTVGTARVVRLTAEVSGMPGAMDAGWVDVTVVGAGGGTMMAPQVQAVDLNGGPLIDRSECVTVAVGTGAAYECGELRLAHGLPVHRTYNRTLAPVLVYNSQNAYPRPTVYADVTVPAAAAVPQTVELVVRVGGAVRRATFPGQDFTPGVARRVGVQWDGSAMTTGVYADTVQVTAHYSTESHASQPVHGEVVVVNRKGTMFGAGWWVAGWEHLRNASGSRKLWVGGDGSTRVYDWHSPGVWVSSDPAGQPDTITGASGVFTRRLPGGGSVIFDGAWHVRTINRLGQTTEFFRDSTTNKLDSIVAPSPAAVAPRWIFTYGPTLDLVTARAPGASDRLVSFAHGLSDARVTAITDPDGRGLVLGYSGASRAVETLRDRRGVTHAFTYDAAWKLASARLWMSTSATANDPIQTFQAGESRGVAQDGGSGTSVAVADAYTLLDGPRTDVADHTRIWLAARGAPARVRDAMGGETVLTRGDTRFPALVTRVRGPNARGDSLIVLRSAGFDTRGRIVADSVHDPFGAGTTAVTTYGWNDTINAPAWVKAPGADTVRIAYDAATRNPLWQQQGGSQRRVVFHYYASGQVRSIHYPHATSGYPATSGRDSLRYDALGNLSQTVSPLGFVTLMYRDALGRVVETHSPVHAGSSSDSASVANTGMRTTHVFDVMDRDTLTTTYGRAMSHARVSTLALVTTTPAETLVVRTTYDAGGLPLAVRRWAMPDSAAIGVILTTYGYDNAGRKVTETHGSDGTVTNTYDAAGNVVQQLTPMGEYLTMEYDALGRLTRRIVPSVMFTPETIDCADLEWTDCTFEYPTFPTGPLGIYTVPADTARFWHDAAGNMVRAENGDAIVSRTYHRGGALATDTLRIRTWERSQTERHVYGIQYGYDAAGRTSSLKHPQNLTSSAQYDQFRYDPVTGAVDTVISRTGLRFSYEQDLLGRVVRDSFPGGVNTYTYDAEGRRISRTGAWVDSLAYDARGKIVRATLYGSDNYYNFYSGIGNLVATEWKGYSSGQDLEEYRVDALGNVFWTRRVSPSHSGNYPEYRHVYEPGQSRVSMIYNRVPPSTYVDTLAFTRDTTTRVYDDAGNVSRGSKRSWRSDYRKLQTRSYFGPDGRLRAEQGFEEIAPTWYMMHERRGYFNEYRYDALGRRILVRTRRDGLCRTVQNTVDCTGGITRYVWSGDNILWEMRGPGADSVPAARLNEVSATAAEFGIVGYTHAGGVDRPLVVWKGGTVVVPHTNWRGVFGKGTNTSGGTSTVAIEWPGFISTAFHAIMTNPTPTTNWMGSLIGGHRDPGGHMYMRNRYYDPATGQFTQTDPIGLGGGMNTYGFANGDPVGNWDPFGTCASEQVDDEGLCPGGLTHDEWYAAEDRTEANALRETGRFLEGTVDVLSQSRFQGLYLAQATVQRNSWRGCTMPRIRINRTTVHLRTAIPPIMLDRVVWDVQKTTPTLETIYQWERLRDTEWAFYSGRLLGFGPENRIIPAVALVNCSAGIAHFTASNHLPALYGGK